MKPVIIITIAVVLITSISITSISAQSQGDIPSWVKNNAVWWGEDKISDSEFISALQFLINNGNLKVTISSDDELERMKELKDKYQQSSIKLIAKNKNLKNDISNLETENERLWKLLDTPKPSSSGSSYNIPSYSEIRYDVDWSVNIGGLNANIYSFGFLEPKPDKFSIDMEIEYARGGSAVQFEISQVKVKLDKGFSYEADENQLSEFNGWYYEDDVNRSIVEIDDVLRELEGDFEILVLVREIENGYYIQDYIFTFPTTLS